MVCGRSLGQMFDQENINEPKPPSDLCASHRSLSLCVAWSPGRRGLRSDASSAQRRPRQAAVETSPPGDEIGIYKEP